MTPEQEHDPEFVRLREAYERAAERGDPEASAEIGLKMLAFAGNLAATDAEPGTETILVAEAAEHEAAGRWDRAEDAYGRALESYQAKENFPMVFKMTEQLARLFALSEQPDRARDVALAGVEAAQRTGMDSIVGMALSELAHAALAVGDVDQARAATDELLRITPNDSMQGLQYARALVTRAACREAMHDETDLDAAQSDLDTAWPLLDAQPKHEMMAGVQSAMAHWWEVSARVRTARHDAAGAADALTQAVACRRALARMPQLSAPYQRHALSKSLRRCGVALAAAQQQEAADAAFAESRALRQSLRG